MAQNKWRLKRTLARESGYRESAEEDLKYAWAAYKGDTFQNLLPGEMSPEQFREMFQGTMADRYDSVWTFTAKVKDKGIIPVGFAAGFWAYEAVRPLMILEALYWAPWATPRARIECTIAFTQDVKDQGIPMMAFVHEQDKRFMEMIAKHGLIRRVGTSYCVFPGERATVWEIGTKDNGRTKH